MGRYDLSGAAAADFEAIFEYGIENFGLEQAVTYQNGLTQRFEALAARPEQYPAVDHIRVGYRRSVYEAHSIYYRIQKDGVLIVRILGQQALDSAF
jgi:toxin ParE1/3/4